MVHLNQGWAMICEGGPLNEFWKWSRASPKGAGPWVKRFPLGAAHPWRGEDTLHAPLSPD